FRVRVDDEDGGRAVGRDLVDEDLVDPGPVARRAFATGLRRPASSLGLGLGGLGVGPAAIVGVCDTRGDAMVAREVVDATAGLGALPAEVPLMPCVLSGDDPYQTAGVLLPVHDHR